MELSLLFFVASGKLAGRSAISWQSCKSFRLIEIKMIGSQVQSNSYGPVHMRSKANNIFSSSTAPVA